LTLTMDRHGAELCPLLVHPDALRLMWTFSSLLRSNAFSLAPQERGQGCVLWIHSIVVKERALPSTKAILRKAEGVNCAESKGPPENGHGNKTRSRVGSGEAPAGGILRGEWWSTLTLLKIQIGTRRERSTPREVDVVDRCSVVGVQGAKRQDNKVFSR